MTTNLLPTCLARIDSLEMRGVVKRFPGVLACDNVDFDIKAGEVHALLGENGAGKSTLMKILYGLYRMDEGEILLNGQPVTIHSPTDALNLGIGMVHQHFMLVDTLTVAENVALGLKSSRGPLMDLDKVEARVRELSKVYGLQVDPRAPVWTLPVGVRQRVEIIKALYRGAALLILDEPTAVLTPQEVDELFVTLHQMTKDGHSLVFISHKLREVLALSDRISVLRMGALIGTVPNENVTREQLARMMVGREVLMERDKAPVEVGEALLSLEDVEAYRVTGTRALHNLSQQLRSGEILGIAGVSGNGQRTLAEVIAGLREVRDGHVTLLGTDITKWGVDKRIEAGLRYIPEERMHDGVIQDFSIAENIILQDHVRRPFSRGIFLDFKAIAARSQQLVDEFRVKTPSIDTPIKSLSGGNIQKVILAREISNAPKVLIAAQPTRGVDIGATEYIHQRLLDQRAEGTAILLISEDLDEVLALSDRIAVLYEGEIMGVVDRKDTNAQELGLMMAGVHKEQLAEATASAS
jgi:simple sugar transport system ATP-binding protein